MDKRCAEAKRWAEEVLPASVKGQRVMVEEVDVGHKTEPLETLIHVLATPPWSMKVLKALANVTPHDVKQVMGLAELCAGHGIPSVR